MATAPAGLTPTQQEAQSNKFNAYIKANPNGDVPDEFTPYGDSTKFTVKNGVLTTADAINSQAQQQAGIASGALKNVGTAAAPLTVPVGSPGDLNLQNPVTNPTGPIDTSQPNPATVNATPFTSKDALVTAQASGPAPQSAGEAMPKVQAALDAPTFYKPDANNPQVINSKGEKLTYDQYIAQGGKADFSNTKVGNPPQPTNATPLSGIEQTLAEDKGYQQLLKDQADYNSVANQSKSLLDFYNQSIKDAGIPAINAELLNAQKIIDGTEDDIRSEVQAVSGFATDSQVLALANARNKSLIKNYNNLLATKQMAMDNINNMVNLAGQDRAFALSAITQKLQIDQQINDYRDKFVNNAKEGYNNIIKAVGYGGLYQSLQQSGDPNAVGVVEKTLGLAPGGLQQLANYVKPLTESEKLDLEIKKSSLETDKLQRANIKSEIANRGSSNNSTSVVDTGTGKVLLTYDKQGNIINTQPITGGTNANNPQALAQSQGNITLINDILQKAKSPTSVGLGANFARDFLVNPFSSNKQDFIAGVQQLTGQLTLDSLVRAKAQGATFGALSEGELNVLAGSATKLNNWAIKDKQGNVTGYNTSASSFKSELDKINNFAKLDYILKGGTPEDVGVQTMPDGTHWTQNSNGTMTKL